MTVEFMMDLYEEKKLIWTSLSQPFPLVIINDRLISC